MHRKVMLSICRLRDKSITVTWFSVKPLTKFAMFETVR